MAGLAPAISLREAHCARLSAVTGEPGTTVHTDSGSVPSGA